MVAAPLSFVAPALHIPRKHGTANARHCLGKRSCPLSVPRSPRVGRSAWHSPRASARGRDSEFSVTGPAQSSGINWTTWRTSGQNAQVPVLPFPAQEVMLPGETKTLHLFEARYLMLFEEVITKYDKRFAHILLSHERAAIAAFGTLVRISEWQRLDVGVKITIEAVGRVMVSAIEQDNGPFIVGTLKNVEDTDTDEEILEAAELEEKFWDIAKRITRASSQLGAWPFREKTEVEPPTLQDSPILGDATASAEAEPVKSCSPDEAMDMLRQAVERASGAHEVDATAQGASSSETSWKAPTRVVSSDSEQDPQLARERLCACSFVCFDLFESSCGERQRAVESKSTVERLRGALDKSEETAKRLEAQAALRKAFSSDDN